MLKHRYISIFLIIAIVLIGWFVWATQAVGSKYNFKLGLDLAGGTELTYKADVSQIQSTGGDVAGSMSTLRDVIERRVNIFGVSEPVVQTETAGGLSGTQENRLIVDLPGVTDVTQAESMIGQTPQLDFDLINPAAQSLSADQLATLSATSTVAATSSPTGIANIFVPTGLDGTMLSNASLQFGTGGTSGALSNTPIVALQFNSAGTKLFASITTQNKGRVLAILLDGQPISVPVINDVITNGQAVIQGSFTAEQAKQLVDNLNYGALPVPISLESTQTVGPSLGAQAASQGVKAGVIGLILIALFLILWYRLPGFVAVIALIMYTLLSLALYKLIPITLTAAGIAGFILSIGMAVDANILIFERLKEELKAGHSIHDAMHLGFSRAWLSIRDSNISSIITSLVLFWLGTSAVKGFALTLGLGVIVSMFTAITVSRTFLFAVSPKTDSKVKKFLFSNGFHSGNEISVNNVTNK